MLISLIPFLWIGISLPMERRGIPLPDQEAFKSNVVQQVSTLFELSSQALFLQIRRYIEASAIQQHVDPIAAAKDLFSNLIYEYFFEISQRDRLINVYAQKQFKRNAGIIRFYDGRQLSARQKQIATPVFRHQWPLETSLRTLNSHDLVVKIIRVEHAKIFNLPYPD